MSSAVVGAARVVFGADSSDFDATAAGVEGVLGRLVEKFHAVEQRLKQVGLAATIGITLPFAGMIAAIDDGAGAYEAAMNKVAAALPDASADQLDALSDAARRLGPAVGKNAIEAAGAVDSLARAGVSAEDILGGALETTLKLSAAGMTDAGNAAGLVTDIMGQFGKTAGDLPDVMTNVVGVLDATKLEFDDLRLGIGQGGAIAAAAGVSFLDFGTSIAATATQFASGASAGTAFKTYIQSLVPKSKEAESAMKRLGLSFFDAQGRMKPMADQAEMLREKLAGLSDKDRTDMLNTIFGADAAATAIGLMQQGREGFEKYRAAVANGDVNAKVAKAMEGTEQAGKNIAAAWLELKIAFGIDTGLIDVIARIKNGFADFLKAISSLPVGVRQAMVAIGALGAAIGPLIWAITQVGAVILANFAAARFGIIGQVLRLLISPMSAILALIGQAGLRGALMMLGQRLLALTGPVGAIISLMLLFKDHIIAGLRAVWTEISATLGPPLTALFDKLQGLFAKLTGGAIGSSISGLIDMLMWLKDAIGTGLVAGILVAGEIIERALGAIIAAISGIVDVVSGVVDVIGALLRGDFAGAWEAAAGVLESVSDAIIDIIAAIVPEVGDSLRAIHSAAKEWLGDRFSAVVDFVSNVVRSMVAYVASIFPGVVSAAQAVYTGVRAWLVDRFGGVIDFVRGMVREVVGLYQWMAKAIGVDVALAPPTPKVEQTPPPKDTKPAPVARTALAPEEGKKKKEKKERKKKERDPVEDAADRARLATQNEIEAARLRVDRDAEAALKRKLDLEQQIDAYKRTGLSVAAATAAATRDMAALDEARKIGQAEELRQDQAAHQLAVAKIAGNRSLVETLERQEEIADRIRALQRDGLSLTEATARATQQQLEVDEARAAVRARLLEDEAKEREIGLARQRGDSEARIRQLQREIDIRKRAREIEERDRLEPGAGVDQATTEWDESDRARQTGEFRTTFKDGIRAALDGDLKGFISGWWKDRVAKGMEDALNSLADLFGELLGKLTGSGGGGDILGSIGGALSGLFGGKSGGAAAPKLPGFKTGGGFKVGGRSGIDANIVAFRATRGEMVDIRHGNDAGPGGGPAVVHLNVGKGELFEPTVAGISGNVTTRTVRQNNARQQLARRQAL
ncbi:phage tail tape measure protein [Sphingomonas sp. Leaf4]|uniref:phage tail tape measure protein n=1 Tax=Sphingomonas sp. Leaf4 TaxID=2876553 RepID=UPI001E2B17F7|nr:phage tail tape measure protein [Sphingomonas sp. Leaf4]